MKSIDPYKQLSLEKNWKNISQLMLTEFCAQSNQSKRQRSISVSKWRSISRSLSLSLRPPAAAAEIITISLHLQVTKLTLIHLSDSKSFPQCRWAAGGSACLRFGVQTESAAACLFGWRFKSSHRRRSWTLQMSVR